MQMVDLVIGSATYRLPMDVDENQVLEELTAAMRAGGGVVELPAGGSTTTTTILVSPGLPVFLERTPIPDEAETGDDDFGEELGDWSFD